jgi:phosphodiesterase/alkaline phosphatase D-like protein
MGAVAVALAAPAAAGAANPFTDGVTAGEITSNSAIVWGQTKKAGKVKTTVKGGGKTLTAKIKSTSGNDFTVQKKMTGLKAATRYSYEFCKGKKCSDTGHFETAPKPSQSKTIHFAYSGDESAVAEQGHNKPFWGNFLAFKSMAAEHNDFNIDFGDTIYSDPEVPGAATALTVKQKWGMYRKKLSVPNQLKVRESAGLYNHWDDHEFLNDYTKAEDGNALYKAGVTAFRDYEPVTYSSKNGIYRTFRWGKNLEVFFLDLRSFRSAKADDDCINATTSQPDLAPTAPQGVRNAFGAVLTGSGLTDTVSPSCLAAINDPNRTMLGSRQYNKFMTDVTASTAKWKVVMTEDPMQQFYALPYDRWEGYAYERVQLLNDLDAANVQGLVFATTDTHAGLANVVRYRTLDNDSAPSNVPAGTPPIDTAYNDYVIGPVATKPFAQEINDTTGSPSAGALVTNAFFKPAPPNGMGMFCAQANANSYAEVTASSSQLKIEYKDENGNTLKDANGTDDCGPYLLP